MALNPYFSQKVKSEQDLYEDLLIESLKLYGQDVYYLPREIINEDTIFNEDIPSRFGSAYMIEMYIENMEGFEGEGDLFTKFGIEIRDQATFIVARRRFKFGVYNSSQTLIDNNITRPREGDLIYLRLSQSLFQIMSVEHDQPFYQLSNLPSFKMRCELFEYSSEDLDTGISGIDNIEVTNAYAYQLTLDSDGGNNFVVGETINQTLASGVIMSGEVAAWADSDNILSLIHVGADDGNYHVFEDSATVTGLTSGGSGLTISANSVTEVNQLHQNEDNQDFDDIDFIDFSESNPFGEQS